MTAELRNFTPYANMRFSNGDANGNEFGIFLVKIAWDILPDGSCVPSAEQEPLALSDEYHGEAGTSALRYPSDMVPFKPRTDFILDATSFAPTGAAQDGWAAGFEMALPGSAAPLISKWLTVSGPRQWLRRKDGWEMTPPIAIPHLDLRYEQAFGGMITRPGRDDAGEAAPVIEACEYNPLGCGFADPALVKDGEAIPAPAILGQGEPVPVPGATPMPAGFGPLPPAWLPRRPLGGTYDDAWRAGRWPGWAADYDFAFHNAAPADMQAVIPPDTAIFMRLVNLHPAIPDWRITLPATPASAMILQDGLVFCCALPPDTVFLDIGRENIGDPRIITVSRIVFRLETTEAIALVPLEEAQASSGGALLPPPAPEDVVAQGRWPKLDLDLDNLRSIARSLA